MSGGFKKTHLPKTSILRSIKHRKPQGSTGLHGSGNSPRVKAKKWVLVPNLPMYSGGDLGCHLSLPLTYEL